MKMLKRTLALMLVLCMMFTAMPFNAFATESTTPETTVPETTVPETTAPETTVPETTVAETTVPATTVAQETVPAATTAALSVASEDDGIATAAATTGISSITMGSNPGTGNTSGEPFAYGTAGSNSFRIPALVTLSNGNLLAAADARWNTTYDGGGLDTIVSVSSDNGDTWNWSFANYLGDNGNTYNGSSSTCFIDPALAVTADDTVYMLCDLYPYGVALNGDGSQTLPTTGNGFYGNGADGDYDYAGKLILFKDGESNANYYLDKNTDGTYTIYNVDGTEVTGYTVDAYFNITETSTGDTSNLFFSNSPYKVTRTGFLYLTKSTDGGKSWSAPELLNIARLTSTELVTLVAPGRGLVTSSGMIIFPVYSYHGDNDPSGNTQRMSFVYSTDNGATWSRSAELSYNWASESAVVELKDGTLRFFFRNGTTNLCYVDYNNGWGTPVVMSGIDTNSNCQISAISYSKTIDDKQVILVSCPTGSNEAGSNQSGASYRLNGKIFAFTVESDNSLTKVGSVNVTSNDAQFMYSCMTELTDGTIGILYEDCENDWGYSDHDSDGLEAYYTMEYDEFDLTTAMGLNFDSATGSTSVTDTANDVTVTTETAVLTKVEVTPKDAETTEDTDGTKTVTKTWSISVNDGAYTGAATVKVPYDSAFDGYTAFTGYMDDGTDEDDAVSVTLEDGYFVCKVQHFSDLTITTSGTTQTVTLAVGETFTVTDETGNYEDAEGNVTPDTDVVTMVLDGEDANNSGEKTKTEITATSSFAAGKQYLIVNNRNSKAMSSTLATGTTWDNKSLSGYSLNGDTDVTSTNLPLWSIVPADNNKFYIMQGTQYLAFSYTYNSYSASLVDTATPLTLSISNDIWYIANEGETCWLSNVGSKAIAVGYGTKYDEGNYWSIYEVTGGATPASTDIAFTGVAPGTTTAKVGNTTYNITVNAISKSTASTVTVGGTATLDALGLVGLGDGYSATYALTSGGSYATLSGTTVKGVADGTATVTATIKYGDITCGTVTYTVTVSEGTPISIKENETAEIEVTLSDGQYVVWSTADSRYVGVAGVYDSTAEAYTNEAVIVGYNITTDAIVVTGTIYNANGTVASVNKWLVTVTENTTSTLPVASTTLTYTIAKIENCTVYYSINGGDLIEIKNDELTAVDEDGDGVTDYYKWDYNILNGTGDTKDASAVTYSTGMHVSFFAKPDEGYGLTTMAYTTTSSSTGQYQYFAIANGNPDGTGSDAWPFDSETQTTWPLKSEGGSSEDSVWKNQADLYSYYYNLGLTTMVSKTSKNCFGYGWALYEGYMTIDQWKIMMTDAIAKGCDGAQLFTKTGSWDADLTFVAEKLPEMKKEIVSILKAGATTPVDYTSGMTLAIGDTINYKITVYNASENFSYSNLSLKDPLTGETWTPFDDADSTETVTSFTYLNSAGETVTYKGNATAYIYNTSLTIYAGNFLNIVVDGKITNEASFAYTYRSLYSVGTTNKESLAVAEILVEVPEYVIDFGLPVEIDLTNDPLVEGDKIKEATAKYGTVTISADRKLIYTPNTILPGTDFITLTFYDLNDDNATATESTALVGYGVRIYPATSVYYEEGFLNSTDVTGWTTTAGADLGKQKSEELGEHTNNYGYDAAYASAGTNTGYITGATGGSAISFTFTGTGFQLYGNSKSASGYVTVYSQGKLNKLYMIDTKLTDVEGNAIEGTYYGLPFISETALPYGTYTVQIKQTNGDATIYLDGVRILNTLQDSSPFTIDLEDNPVFYELRDSVLNALGVESVTDSEYTDAADRVGKVDAVKDMAGQVYNAANGATALILDENYTLDESTTVQELLDNGPKNELYLYKEQTLVFKVTTDRVMQLGLKAPTGSATYTLNGTSKTLATSVDMFYEIAAKGEASNGLTVTIKNTGDKVLSVTLLKICDDPNATFPALTQEDIETAMLAMYGLTEEEDTETPETPEVPEVPETPTEPSKPTEPVEPSKPTEPEIQETKPSKPGKPESNKPGNNKPNKPGKDEEKTDKAATLNITYVSLFGRKVGTAALTKEGTGRCTFSAAEIRAAAPAGRRAVWMIPTMIDYGTSASIVVPVI